LSKQSFITGWSAGSRWSLALTFIAAILLGACGKDGDFPLDNLIDGGTPPAPATNVWTWVSGSNTVNQPGIYGTKGVPDPANVPGARSGSVSWTDSSGNFWLFGGQGFDSTGGAGVLNDLWKYDGIGWTWISGSDVADQLGIYGTKGMADPANVPGGRLGSVSWMDANGDLWLFGGLGNAETSCCELNDLWKFDGTNWTWVSGNEYAGQVGIYGTKGVADPANVPGGRWGSVSWIDANGNFWLFGGNGQDSGATAGGFLNDLWKFDGSNWTWVSGSDIREQPGIYGMKGVTDPTNVPGARIHSASWIDASGNLWLFGGAGLDGDRNDLWKFDGTNWTWISGSDVANQRGTYGTKGVPDPANVPGARAGSVGWVDSSGSLWLFGGVGYDGIGIQGNLNDLWKYQP